MKNEKKKKINLKKNTTKTHTELLFTVIGRDSKDKKRTNEMERAHATTVLD